jgi:predicted nucleic acid-binding protein
MPAFVDTNVLLYTLDTKAAPKRDIAATLLRRRDLVLSVQVLQEFYVQATHARRLDALTHEDAVALMATWRRFPIVDNTVALVDAALTICASARLSFWDAMIVAAAASAGCDALYSEDMSAGQTIAGVHVVNPFAP